MKINLKSIALMTALAAGVAGADGTVPTANPNGYTAANTGIKNTATANFTDPTGTSNTSTSNTVTTTVLPLPSFDIVYADGKTDGSGTASNPANSTTTDTPDKQVNVSPGAKVTDDYYLVNNGNTDLIVHVAPQMSGVTDVTYSFPAGTTLTNVVKDANGNIISADVTLPVNSTIKFTQTTTVPTTATAGSFVGASPAGTVASTAINGVPSGSTLQENQTLNTTTGALTGPAAGTDLQYQALEVYNATLKNDPKTPDGTTDVTTTVTIPGTTTPVPGYNGGTPGTDTTSTPPAGTDGTPAGTPGTTPISTSLSGDKQIAYPPADSNAGPDVVVFTNTVANNGPLQDVVTLAPINSTTNTWTKTGVGTYTDQNGNTVQFIDPATGKATDTVTVPANGVANYTTQVTYPDSNTTNNPKPIEVVIGATSGNNPNIKADPTTDIIMPPAATFGDTKQVNQAAGVVEDPSQPYGPNNTLATPATTAPGATTSFPMSISNSGTYDDKYTLTGYVVIPNTDGTSTTVPVVYTDASGNALTPSGSAVVNGVTVPVYTTAVIPANGTANFTASVTVPATAAYTGAGAAPTLQQTATGVASTIVMKDTNDVLPIAAAGSVYVGKFTNTGTSTPPMNTQAVTDSSGSIITAVPTAAQVGNPADGYDGINATKYAPGVQYDYQIIAKNSYNSNVTKFVLSDPLDAQLLFQSATCTVKDAAGKIVSSTAVSGIAVDTPGATVSCPPVTLLPGGSTEVLQIFVKIK